jgi:hypothetical protein
MDHSLNELIARLQHLHLEQARIIRALEDIAEIEIVPVERGTAPTITANLTVVPVPPVVAPVPVIAEPATPVASPVTPASHTVVNIFHIGQRVYITNRITHVPLLRRATEADRTAIVTHFTPSHVAIRTINGYHTHRHPKNLRPL